MNSADNSIPFEKMEADMIKELYKKTPLKKRPIQLCALPSDEKDFSLTPKACTLSECCISKHKFIDTCAESTAVVDPVQKGMHVPAAKTSEEAEVSPPVEIDPEIDMMDMAQRQLKKPLQLFSRGWWAFWRKYCAQKDWANVNRAIILSKGDHNLRERPQREEIIDFRIRFKLQRSKPMKKDTTSEKKNESTSSIGVLKKAGKKQGKKKVKRAPKKTSVNTKNGKRTCKFAGSLPQKMYTLSPELADIVGHEKMSAGAIIEAMHYVFLERNLFEADKKHINCDDELSKKIFEGKRRLQTDDIKKYLEKHVTPTD